MAYKDLVKLMNKMTPEMAKLAGENKFEYIYTKAWMYLKIGPDKYRAKDFFKQPNIDLDADDLKDIEIGCQQILEGKGLSEDNPFTNLGIYGFYTLFEFLHFKRIKQELITNNKGMNGMLDKLTMQHVVDEDIVNYFNLVEIPKEF